MPIYNNLYNGKLKPRARELRHNMTPQERKLWYCYLYSYPIKIHRQHMIGRFIADFYCAAAKLVIELDGSGHYTEQGKAYDSDRTDLLKCYSIKVIRFSNADVDNHFSSVCQQIDHEIQSILHSLRT